ncbi:MAG: type I restriction endonuclease [Chloroflexota bacterium]|nr:type I restriction endonuclease [Chloroflexota bacterium]MDE2952045.1 type I restriction endonuclease [Chloroflexota bacterium]
MSFFDALNKLAEDVNQHRDKMNSSEATTAQVSVKPFLQKLGYDTHNPDEIREQYAILGDAADFAILQEGKPIMVLEAKKASEALNSKHWKQLFQYFNAAEAHVGILTNGIAYRFFADMKKSGLMDKEPFLEIDLLNLDKQKVDVLAGFTKTRFDAEKSVRDFKLFGLVERELNHPSNEFVKHFAKQVHAGAVLKTVIDEYRPLVKRAIDEFVNQETPNEDNGPISHDGVIEVPVFATHRGHEFEATLLVDEVMNWHKKPVYIRFQGNRMSCTRATLNALHIVSPQRKTGKSAWLFWQFNHPITGENQPIKVIYEDVQSGGDLRQHLAAKYT